MTYKLTTIEIEEAVARCFGIRQNIIVPNVNWGFYIHECDLLVVRKSGYLLEVEIKISKADLKKDQEKHHGHLDRHNRIRELWFAIPEYLQDSIEYIPERAGILTVYENEWIKCLSCHILRKPQINSKVEKLCENEKLMIARLGTMRIWTLKRKIIDMKRKRTKKKYIQSKGQLKLII